MMVFRSVVIALLALLLPPTGHAGPPLIEAVRAGDTGTVKRLLAEGANVNAKGEFGWTALMEAAWSGRTEIVRLLLEQGAQVNARTNAGTTALRRAEKGGYNAIVQLLKQAVSKQ